MDRDLRLTAVGRRYGIRGPWVLRGVDLVIAPGTLTRMEGANGTGKSTLLRLLARLDTPTEGRVTGRPRTAYVPERFPSALPFTAAGYLTHLGTVHGLSRALAARRAADWLERLDAGAYAGTPMARLSKGSSQKVAVAQALVGDPELLVLDEAWTGLDTPARAELERAVAERTAAGGAVVFVDHDPRRLAGVPDATYTVLDGGLRPRTDSGSPPPAGPVTVVVVRGPSGGRLPLEAVRIAVSAEGTASGGHRLTVPASRSDVLLRALLTAHPPWHVERVEPAGASPLRPTGREPADAPVPSPAGRESADASVPDPGSRESADASVPDPGSRDPADAPVLDPGSRDPAGASLPDRADPARRESAGSSLPDPGSRP